MNVYEMITTKILAEMEQGTVPWHKSWIGVDAPIRWKDKKVYRGVNTLLLNKPGEWLTFKQCTEAGGKVKKGEKASVVVFFEIKKKINDEGEEETFPFLKYYNVFHISQCEGIKSKVPPRKPENNPISKAEQIISQYIEKSGLKLTIVNASDRAFYRPKTDEVVIPDISQFDSPEEYYSTLFHELVHSTGAKTRLDRKQDPTELKKVSYGKEELIAEIGSAMLMSFAGIGLPETLKNSAAYLNSWVKAIQGDNHLIVSASSAASKAVDLILGQN